uniref:Uncharacterized protein n=1 Tax=Glossina palpalis gambiensis TaxID=67801 RepID=A0A1B0ASF4_9MUSC
MRTVCQDNSLKINIIPLYGSLRRVTRTCGKFPPPLPVLPPPLGDLASCNLLMGSQVSTRLFDGKQKNKEKQQLQGSNEHNSICYDGHHNKSAYQGRRKLHDCPKHISNRISDFLSHFDILRSDQKCKSDPKKIAIL